jgi:hypothetical protein
VSDPRSVPTLGLAELDMFMINNAAKSNTKMILNSLFCILLISIPLKVEAEGVAIIASKPLTPIFAEL